MHPIEVVFRKELKDGSRDRRAMMTALLFPLLGPVLVYFMLTTIINQSTDSKAPEIPVIGAENAPGLMQWLEEQNVRIKVYDGPDPKQSIRDKHEELILAIPADFETRYREARTATVELIYDGSRTDARSTVSRVATLIERYGAKIASLRLIARGVSPEIMRVVALSRTDVASKQQRAATVLNFIPLYIILAAFVSGMGLAIDSTAGERERRSIEPLLINPVERFHLVTGKWLAASLFAAFGMSVTAVLCILAMTQVPLADIGLRFSISWPQVAAIIITTTPLALLATSLQLWLGIFAKSFKDAQSYMGLLVLLPILPSMFLLLHPVTTKTWMFAVPVLGQQVLLVDLIGGKDIPIAGYTLSAVSCVIVSFALVLVTARLFKRESILTS